MKKKSSQKSKSKTPKSKPIPKKDGGITHVESPPPDPEPPPGKGN